MRVKMNGQYVQLPADLSSIADLINHFSLSDRILIVELNGEIKDKKQYDTTMINEMDSIEFVHFVGGG
ncbi:thiamine biosynthesis protein ThiS [[Bacillus] enclensis]|jgi:sulfur carrier protein|uniref:Sulfur carrier protein n=2 Tax=Rossellomorea TaxID=2837508 RepID=A0A0V8HK13_9BACI|nr:sulfur carrier protein ThiS [[Bacillus] enclensis]OAT82513.1 thiamine biosynthesis protein ThiS [Bacillus sp. MKU004]QWC20939.1 sulfur carrier protein ThiS [Bacillus haikouensis]KSU62845.1 thiamine biosynthesis protein ThiS [[Bacillus] enclensis]MBH9965087.1 sulfur carrier protein ThiS [[Bacillus] enclensis]SCC10425.1 sulfur carrier protein [[Bacillus] enclensis]